MSAISMSISQKALTIKEVSEEYGAVSNKNCHKAIIQEHKAI